MAFYSSKGKAKTFGKELINGINFTLGLKRRERPVCMAGTRFFDGNEWRINKLIVDVIAEPWCFLIFIFEVSYIKYINSFIIWMIEHDNFISLALMFFTYFYKISHSDHIFHLCIWWFMLPNIKFKCLSYNKVWHFIFNG